MSDKTKTIFRWIGIIACILICLFVGWNLHASLHKEDPVKVVVSPKEYSVKSKDSAETFKSNQLEKSTLSQNEATFNRITERRIYITKIIKQNEEDKNNFFNASDSIKLHISDSLLRSAGYR